MVVPTSTFVSPLLVNVVDTPLTSTLVEPNCVYVDEVVPPVAKVKVYGVARVLPARSFTPTTVTVKLALGDIREDGVIRTAELPHARDAVAGTAVPLLLSVTCPKLVGSRGRSNTTSMIELSTTFVAFTSGIV